MELSLIKNEFVGENIKSVGEPWYQEFQSRFHYGRAILRAKDIGKKANCFFF